MTVVCGLRSSSSDAFKGVRDSCSRRVTSAGGARDVRAGGTRNPEKNLVSDEGGLKSRNEAHRYAAEASPNRSILKSARMRNRGPDDDATAANMKSRMSESASRKAPNTKYRSRFTVIRTRLRMTHRGHENRPARDFDDQRQEDILRNRKNADGDNTG